MISRKAWSIALVAVACATGACSGSGSGGGEPTSLPDGGTRGAGTGDAGSSTGSSSGGSGSSSGGGSGSGSGGSSGTCQTYASKAYACCQSESSCNGVTEDTFLQYCEGFLPGCQAYYACFLSASSCAEADACPTAGNGGCS